MNSLIFLGLALTLTISGVSARGPGRAPAVEDFVGVEMPIEDHTPQGTQALFNFQSDIKDHQGQPPKSEAVIVSSNIPVANKSSQKFPLMEIVGSLLVLLLPLVTWFLAKQKATNSTSAEATNETTHDNVAVLRPRVKTEEVAKDGEDELKRAS